MKPAAPQNEGIWGVVATTHGQGTEAPRGAFPQLVGLKDGGKGMGVTRVPSPALLPHQWWSSFFFGGGISGDPKEKPKKALAATRKIGGGTFYWARCSAGGHAVASIPSMDTGGCIFGGNPHVHQHPGGGAASPSPVPLGWDARIRRRRWLAMLQQG